MRLASTVPAAAGSIAPQSVAPAGVAQSGWIDMVETTGLSVLAQTGAGGDNVAVSFEQAKTNVGGNAKALGGQFAAAAIEAADSETFIEGDVTELDINGGFRYVRVTMTNNAAGPALVAAAVFAVKR